VMIGAACQRCRVHFLRTVFGGSPRTPVRWSQQRFARSSPSPARAR
jgi:hypothetical protein